jgi:transposase
VKTNTQKLLGRLLETKSEKIKFGVDVHARDLVVSVQEDDARPLRPQRMLRAQLLCIVRGLVAAGAESYVIVAETLMDRRRQKTDQLDAAAWCDKLGRYLRGNVKAMTPVRVPSEEEQRGRSEGRLRDQLKQSRHQWEARGRSLLLFHGYHVSGQWWRGARWAELERTLPAWLLEQLGVMRQTILQLDAQERALRTRLEASAPKELPKAVGALTWVMLLREICDWT